MMKIDKVKQRAKNWYGKYLPANNLDMLETYLEMAYQIGKLDQIKEDHEELIKAND